MRQRAVSMGPIRRREIAPYFNPKATIFRRRIAICGTEKKPARALDEFQPGGPMAFARFLIQAGPGDDSH
jgi:hypothetical protein